MKQFNTFIQQLANRNDVRQLLDALIGLLTGGSPEGCCRIYVRDPLSDGFTLCRSVPEAPPESQSSLAASAPLANYFRRHSGTVLSLRAGAGSAQNEFESAASSQLAGLGLVICAPLFSRGELLGLIGIGRPGAVPVIVTEEFAELARIVGPFLDHLIMAGARDLIGRISNGVAHDVQGLLTPVSAVLQLAEAGGESNLKKALELLPVARESLKALEGLLHHARSTPGETLPKRTDIRVDELVPRIIQIMRLELEEKGIEVRTDLEPVTAWVDETLILRLIRNLTANSRNAVSAGGWIHLKVHRLSGAAEARNGMRISVSDSGPGFEPGKLETIFHQRFNHQAGNAVNSGIGLAVCRWIVHLHQGELRIFSSPGRPTEVQVDIPVPAARS